jgi:hypothetical protein
MQQDNFIDLALEMVLPLRHFQQGKTNAENYKVRVYFMLLLLVHCDSI